jgi:hypothetical protein
MSKVSFQLSHLSALAAILPIFDILTHVYARVLFHGLSHRSICVRMRMCVCARVLATAVPITVLATRRVDADTLPPTAKGADHYEYHVHYDHCTSVCDPPRAKNPQLAPACFWPADIFPRFSLSSLLLLFHRSIYPYIIATTHARTVDRRMDKWVKRSMIVFFDELAIDERAQVQAGLAKLALLIAEQNLSSAAANRAGGGRGRGSNRQNLAADAAVAAKTAKVQAAEAARLAAAAQTGDLSFGSAPPSPSSATEFGSSGGTDEFDPSSSSTSGLLAMDEESGGSGSLLSPTVGRRGRSGRGGGGRGASKGDVDMSGAGADADDEENDGEGRDERDGEDDDEVENEGDDDEDDEDEDDDRPRASGKQKRGGASKGDSGGGGGGGGMRGSGAMGPASSGAMRIIINTGGGNGPTSVSSSSASSSALSAPKATSGTGRRVGRLGVYELMIPESSDVRCGFSFGWM